MFQVQNNARICQTVNDIDLFMLYFLRATVDSTWRGTVNDPFLSRLFYIISGEGTITFQKDRKLTMTAGNWYLLPPGCSFSYSCDGILDHLGFQFKLCGSDGIDLFRNTTAPCMLCGQNHQADFFFEMLDRHTLLDGLQVRQKLYDILFAFIKEHSIILPDRGLSVCVSKAVAFIRQNLSVQLTTEAVAEAASVSVSTLVKHFKSELSMSVHDYIYDIVLSDATHMLLNSDLPILYISEKYGFCDQFYFSRRFRERFGISPRTYRKTAIG